MEQIRIRHCKLRVLRKGGWSWGREPQKLIAAGSKTLPEIITRKILEKLATLGINQHYSHIRIRCPIKLGELMQISDLQTAAEIPPQLSSRLELQIVSQLLKQIDRLDKNKPIKQKSKSNNIPEYGKRLNDLIEVFMQWQASGQLASILLQFTDQDLAQWECAILRQTGQLARETQITSEQLETLISKCKDLNISSKPQTLRLLLLAEIIQLFGRQASRDTLLSVLQQLLDTVEPTGKKQLAGETLNPAFEKSFADTQADKPHGSPARLTHNKIISGEVRVHSVLPFICLGVLHSTGCMDVINATLQAARIEESEYFAASFAYKLLEPPQGGWHRSREADQCVAAFCGMYEPPTGEQLSGFSRYFANGIVPLDAYLCSLLSKGHNAATPLYIARINIKNKSQYLILDMQGMFPVACVDNTNRLLNILSQFQSTLLLVDETSMSAEFASFLQDYHLDFITNASPLRHEHWRVVGRRQRFWTNDWSRPESWLVTAAKKINQATEISQELAQLFLENKRSLVTADNFAFERSMALSVMMCLATIAWELWRDQQPTDALIALQRLQDLDGKIIFHPESVIVRPALGRRYLDLQAQGFFREIPRVPWLGGRPLVFSGI